MPMATIDPRQRSAFASLRQLFDGIRYFPAVFATNGAGREAGQPTNGFVIDLSPPVCATVYDGPGIDFDFVGSRAVAVSWGEMVDHGSGLAEVRVGVRRMGDTGTPSGLAPVGAAERAATLDAPWLEHGVSYQSVVSVADRVGHAALCASNGFTADFTPPTAGNASSLLGTPQLYDGLARVAWSHFDDPESGIVEYFVAVGTEGRPEAFAPYRTVGDASEALLSGLALPQGGRALVSMGAHDDDSLPLGRRTFFPEIV